jgi:hypothetical protein
MLISIPSMRLDEEYRPDLLVDNSVIIKIKAVEKLMPVHPNRARIYPLPDKVDDSHRHVATKKR